MNYMVHEFDRGNGKKGLGVIRENKETWEYAWWNDISQQWKPDDEQIAMDIFWGYEDADGFKHTDEKTALALMKKYSEK